MCSSGKQDYRQLSLYMYFFVFFHGREAYYFYNQEIKSHSIKGWKRSSLGSRQQPPTVLSQISEKYGFPEENIYKVYKKCKRG